ncbi:hypothetical protein Esi_0026_0154 [Ectocarpus siliculosus]|uniref:Uncharacterized protein n=1 Tax=Ectocarpus siliculosus TaxID=2880 RepID=D8LJP4_ECTSI|nr:hypothetical protein Esi_0026_0154 [Ectocarpus siliculosus]|eukprot:CBN77071.1 hypothetical protein Esi_0026_0154 [Ectocarpus siliculosus]
MPRRVDQTVVLSTQYRHSYRAGGRSGTGAPSLLLATDPVRARCSPRADRVGGQKKRRGAGAGTPASTVVGPTTMPVPASTKPPIAPPPVRRPLHARKSAFIGFPAHPSPVTTAGPAVRLSILSSPSMPRVGGASGASGAAAAGTAASRSTVGPAAVAVAATGATAVMPPAAPSFQAAAAAVMPAAVPSGQPSQGSMAAARYAAAVASNAAAAAAATAAMSSPAPPGQLFGAASSWSSAFQTQQLARDDMDVDPSKLERISTATAVMARALASVLQAKLSLAGRPSMSKAEEEALLWQSVIADADLARAQAAMEELREAEWASNQMDVDDDEEYEGPWPMEVDG